MTTAPGWTVTVVVVLIVSVSIPIVFETCRQRKQKVVAISGVSAARPIRNRVTADQSACTQVHDRDCRSLAIAQTVEGGCTCPVNTAFITQCPVLVAHPGPTVDLHHLACTEESSACELIRRSRRCFGRSVVTSVGTSASFGSLTICVARINTNIAVISATIVLATTSTTRAFAESSPVTTVGTSRRIGPIIPGRCVVADLNVVARTLIGSGRTFITIRYRVRLTDVVLYTSVGAGTGSPRVVGVAVTGIDGVAGASGLAMQIVSTAVIAFAHRRRTGHVTTVATTTQGCPVVAGCCVIAGLRRATRTSLTSGRTGITIGSSIAA